MVILTLKASDEDVQKMDSHQRYCPICGTIFEPDIKDLYYYPKEDIWQTKCPICETWIS